MSRDGSWKVTTPWLCPAMSGRGRPPKHALAGPQGCGWSVCRLTLFLLTGTFFVPPALAGSVCGMEILSSPVDSDQGPAATGEFPWLVSLQDMHGTHLAFGSILSQDWLLSTASAFHNITQVMALLGAADPSKLQSFPLPISTIIPHEAFDELTLDHDLALLQTPVPIEFNEAVQPICVPFQRFPSSAMEDCWVVGWPHPEAGSSSLWKLSVVDVDPCPLHRMVSTECCSHREGDSVPGCLGYPGNPVVCQVKESGQWMLKGILTEGGARCYGPFLYTRVAYYSDWIMATTTEWGPPVHAIPFQRHFEAPEEFPEGLFELPVDETDLRSFQDHPDDYDYNETEWLNASSRQGPAESRANSGPLYYDYYGGDVIPIGAAGASGRPLWGLFSAGLLTWWTAGQMAN
ncbi:inactive serine protease 54 isoform X3 [Anolis carolinensis]|uniref:inactive serine protease 54 isoform X3 n=1 Tax=Anolis carolinensis TaxID=28377 RepID=UPI002F2B49B4